MNTVFWSTLYKSCAAARGDPGEAEMKWLRSQLENARSEHHGVTLAMHIPPGMDGYSSSHRQCKEPVAFWKPNYSAEFGALMSAYSDVVRLALAGHTHMDDFRVFSAGPALPPLRITPSVSPIYNNNPAFSVMTYSLTTAAAADITTFFLDLSSKAPSWTEEYRFDSAYGVGSFSAGNLSTIVAAIRSGEGSARTTFERNYAVSRPSPIHPSNFAFYSCTQSDFTAASYSGCVCGAAAPVK